MGDPVDLRLTAEQWGLVSSMLAAARKREIESWADDRAAAIWDIEAAARQQLPGPFALSPTHEVVLCLEESQWDLVLEIVQDNVESSEDSAAETRELLAATAERLGAELG